MKKGRQFETSGIHKIKIKSSGSFFNILSKYYCNKYTIFMNNPNRFLNKIIFEAFYFELNTIGRSWPNGNMPTFNKLIAFYLLV